MQAGERNRGLSIIKSRGTAHSNQVRELVLDDTGASPLADTSTAVGGEVLMGTLRWEKERADRAAAQRAEAGAQHRRVRLDAEESELELRLKSLQKELLAKQVEKALMESTTELRDLEKTRGQSRILQLRGADANHAGGSEGVS